MLKRAILLVISASVLLSASAAYAIGRDGLGLLADMPPPRLLSPSSERVTVAPEGVLFKWSIHEAMNWGPAHYDLRIYKGSQRLGPQRVYMAEIPVGTRETFIPAYAFKEGGLYTAALRIVYKRAGPTRWCTITFTAVTDIKTGGSDAE